MPKPARPVDVINSAVRGGTGIGRFRISKEQAAELRKAEERGGQAEGLKVLLTILRRV